MLRAVAAQLAEFKAMHAGLSEQVQSWRAHFVELEETFAGISEAAAAHRLSDRSAHAWETFKGHRSKVRRLSRGPRAVAAWMRLDRAMNDLGVGSDEFASAVEAAVENNGDALDELRTIAPELAALVDDLAPTTDGDAAAAAIIEFVRALRDLHAALEADDAADPSDTAATGDEPPQLRVLAPVIVRHGPTAASRELLAA